VNLFLSHQLRKSLLPCQWRRIIGTSRQAAIGILKKNDCLLHSTAKTRLIPFFAQTYPQKAFYSKIDEHHANVFATIHPVQNRRVSANAN
ncbi:hypothetical protein, partial [Pectobacterium carotovorum]|uniref:hypothetical protein n=1 Tax=Pectobacterium carotovorum TaxID=554 RepID=UPI0020C0DFAF